MFNVCPDDLLRSPMFINLQHSHPGPMLVKFQRSVPCFQAKEMAPSPMVSTPPALRNGEIQDTFGAFQKWRI